jgi:hypothetical protein
MKPMHRILPLSLLLLLAACGGDRPGASAAPDSAGSKPAPADPPPAPAAWRSNPAEGVTVTPGTPMTVEAGPHTVLWQEGAPELAPPYTVRAELHKRSGRLHEGYGILFGATGLEGAEAEQAYSYFLVRGDGSFLVKRRAGAQTPVVRDWTRHPRINRDAEGSGRRNALEVRVAADTTVFLVNGAEVARVPSSELAVRGRAGLRVAHEVVLEVDGFQAGAVADSVAP